MRAAYPDHAVLGEEFGLQGPDQAEFQWIIDPLDGTTNFIHGLPNYAVSIALTQRGQVTQACIYDPSRNELFTASRGGGTFLNDRRVRLGPHPLPRRAAGRPLAQLGRHGAGLGAFPQDGRKQRRRARRLGATVLDLAYVACGRLDGFCGVGLKPWDVAAGSLLVLEAGGLVADFDGEQGWMDSGNVLAASPKIFTQMLAGLNPSASI